jgi:hypothetical protein
MHYRAKTKIIALSTALSFGVVACGGSETIQAPKVPSGSKVQFGPLSEDSGEEADLGAEDILKGGTAGINSATLSRAKKMDDLNQEINRDYQMLSLAKKTKIDLEIERSNIQTKKITPDSGAAWGQGFTAAALASLGIAAIFFTGGIGGALLPFIGAGVAGGNAIQSGMTNAQIAAEVEKSTKWMDAALSEVDKKISDLNTKIAQSQAKQSELIKSEST